MIIVAEIDTIVQDKSNPSLLFYVICVSLQKFLHNMPPTLLQTPHKVTIGVFVTQYYIPLINDRIIYNDPMLKRNDNQPFQHQILTSFQSE